MVPSKGQKRTSQIVTEVEKRDGSIVPFDLNRIINAVQKSMIATGEGTRKEAIELANKVLNELERIKKRYKRFVPTVEGIQDAVEKEFILSGYVKTAKAFILYREKRAALRAAAIDIPEELKALSEESRQYFHTQYNEFVYLRTYARWIEEKGRRETWVETVKRYLDFMRENLGDKLTEKEYQEVYQAVLNQKAMPSMRLLQFSGKAARNTHACAYNCSFIAPKKVRDFSEVMYLLMCGTGVGFSVESQNVQALPQIAPQTGEVLETHVIADSKEGWCKALVIGMKAWFEGQDVQFDYSKIRPAGSRLKTFGGRSSGPEPLRSLLDFSRIKILSRQGRRLNNLDVHDILCKIGEIVVTGGVRRSAMISLSDLDDSDMRDAKVGQFYFTEPQRSIANNSAVYNEKPTSTQFLEEWISLMKSGTGERGIFNRGSLIDTLPERRIDVLKQDKYIVGNKIVGILGTNPCGEIILRPKQFCNLTEIVARPEDNEKTLLEKARIATIIGTYQSSLTNFNYLSVEWQRNCERENLLGVSITGQWDCPAVRHPKMLEKIKQIAIETNAEYAKRFEINPSTAITCVKPSGTVSQVLDCASGMHARYAPYYIRRVRISATDPLFKMLKDQGVPFHPEVGQRLETATTFVLEFPVKSPKGAICRTDINAIKQLEHWKMVKEHYTEHNPSVTITVDDDEWIDVANWVYKNWAIVGGLSFLPKSKHAYQLAPYEEITKEQYNELAKRMNGIDFSKIMAYEFSDTTEVKKELACVGGACELD